MRDLTEALLIEMERRADALAEGFDEDPDEMSRHELADLCCGVQGAAQAIAKDVAELCEHLRAKVTA